jgi:hypothetical protein
MKLEAVITCVNYSDFLAHTLPVNRAMFDRMVVVTGYEDKETQRVCEYWHVECVKTEAFGSHRGEFAKGAGINEGLARLPLDGWAVHMDADIMVPPMTRNLISQASLDPACIYGCDRFIVPNFAAWEKFVHKPRLVNENRSWVHLDAFPLGVRVAIDSYGGYIPIGFFQMWNPAVSGFTRYPEGHKTAAREDAQFATQWPRSARHLIPELVVYHLESEKAAMGANWAGRTTKPFTLEDAQE